MKYLKKIIAISSIITIVLASTITSAANTSINGATATNNGLTTSNQVVITKAGVFTAGNEITSVTITTLSGATVTTTLVATGDDSNINTSTLNITTASLTNNLSYVVSFTTATGDFGTTTLRVGTPTNDTLTVTANVQPVLKFDMEASNKNFGTLTTTATGVTTGLEVGTNAVGGLTISAQTTNGGLKSTTASHTINLTGNDALYNNELYQFSSVVGTTDSASGATIGGVGATTMNTTNQTVTVYTANKPQNFSTTNYDVNFTVSAQIAESTPAASDYTDVIIFTATSNF